MSCTKPSTEERRFVSTEEIVYISGGKYEIIYDKYTRIVYISSTCDYAITPLIGIDKLPMTIDEYKNQKIKTTG